MIWIWKPQLAPKRSWELSSTSLSGCKMVGKTCRPFVCCVADTKWFLSDSWLQPKLFPWWYMSYFKKLPTFSISFQLIFCSSFIFLRHHQWKTIGSWSHQAGTAELLRGGASVVTTSAAVAPPKGKFRMFFRFSEILPTNDQQNKQQQKIQFQYVSIFCVLWQKIATKYQKIAEALATAAGGLARLAEGSPSQAARGGREVGHIFDWLEDCFDCFFSSIYIYF